MRIRLIAREFATCRIRLSVRFYFSFGMPNTEKVSNGSNSGGLLLDGVLRKFMRRPGGRAARSASGMNFRVR